MVNFITGILLITSFAVYAKTSVTDLQERLAVVQTMRADFNQTVYAENKTVLQSASGRMEYKKPNLFRWQVIRPIQNLLISDGKKLWNYDEGLAQVTVQPIPADQELTPLSFMLEDLQRLPKNFHVDSTSRNCYLLTPKQENANFVNINICFAQDRISSLRMLDHLGQTSVFEFANIANNQQIPNSKFNFVPPKGVDVIGEE